MQFSVKNEIWPENKAQQLEFIFDYVRKIVKIIQN